MLGGSRVDPDSRFLFLLGVRASVRALAPAALDEAGAGLWRHLKPDEVLIYYVTEPPCNHPSVRAADRTPTQNAARIPSPDP